MTSAWSIAGSDNQLIVGNVHLPDTSPRGVVIIAHGFKGYKDYGMFPRLAEAMAAAGFIAHRFNFSHSGMTDRIDTFQRPDLFERDTWNRQVFDLRAVIDAVSRDEIAGAGLPYVLFGHSRGGVTALLTAGRFAHDPIFAPPVGIVTAASPATANPLSPEEKERLLRDGFIESPSSRTGQRLRVGAAFITEQIRDPQSHDLVYQVARIRCPLLIAHGESDPTVPAAAAGVIARAARSPAHVIIIPEADHVFNTPNPVPAGWQDSVPLSVLIDAAIGFALDATREA